MCDPRGGGHPTDIEPRATERPPRRRRLTDEHRVPALGPRGGRRHRGDQDVRARPEVGEPLREVDEGGVGGAAREVGRARVAGGGADDVDDAPAPLGLHDREHGPGHADVAEQFQVPVGRPLLVGGREKIAGAD